MFGFDVRKRMGMTPNQKRWGFAIAAVLLAVCFILYGINHRHVSGHVASVHYSYRVNGKPTFLNLGRRYPFQEFTVVIWGEDRDKFQPSPETLYGGKNIRVTGRITSFRGRLEIVVTSPSQIEIE
jgi:DNA/RNA endonuclease YhcR with UshA esterase domain